MSGTFHEWQQHHNENFGPEDIDHEDDLACATCRGGGTVNPLTAPPGFFCAVTTECPDCDGTGRI